MGNSNDTQNKEAFSFVIFADGTVKKVSEKEIITNSSSIAYDAD